MIIAGITGCEDTQDSRHTAGILLRDYLISVFCPKVAIEKIVTLSGGKPVFLSGECGFSVSHCKDAVCCFLNCNIQTVPDLPDNPDVKIVFFDEECTLDIGADMEQCGVRDLKRMRTVAEKKYFANEQKMLFSLADSEFEKEFLRMWTQKESICKLTGEGISAITKYDTLTLPSNLCVRTVAENYKEKILIISFCIKK